MTDRISWKKTSCVWVTAKLSLPTPDLRCHQHWNKNASALPLGHNMVNDTLWSLMQIKVYDLVWFNIDPGSINNFAQTEITLRPTSDRYVPGMKELVPREQAGVAKCQLVSVLQDIMLFYWRMDLSWNHVRQQRWSWCGLILCESSLTTLTVVVKGADSCLYHFNCL